MIEGPLALLPQGELGVPSYLRGDVVRGPFRLVDHHTSNICLYTLTDTKVYQLQFAFYKNEVLRLEVLK